MKTVPIHQSTPEKVVITIDEIAEKFGVSTEKIKLVGGYNIVFPLLDSKLIVTFEVLGLAVPWRAPAVFRKIAVKPKRVREWQKKVAIAAHDAYSQEPYDGPVEIHMTFVKKYPKAKRWWHWWTTTPDIDNLQKAICDAIRGLKTGRTGPICDVGRIIVDDKQVVRVHEEKVYGEENKVIITVMAVQ